MNPPEVGRLVEVACEVLDGRRDILEGARALRDLLFKCGLETDEDLIIILGVDSESDRFPVGKARDKWDPKALAELDPEMKASAEFYRKAIEDACRNIVARFDYRDDADGDALRRVALQADMSKAMDVDFMVDVPSEAAGIEVARLAAARGYKTKVHQNTETPRWTCYCTRSMLVTYETVIAAQKELDEMSAPVGGRSDGWGTFGNKG